MKQRSELDLKQALGVLRRRLPVIVLCAVVVAGAAYAFTKREAKKYTTTASVVFNNDQLSQEIAGVSTTSSFNSRLAQQATDLELLKGGDMAAKTASLIGHGLTAQQVLSSLSVSGQGESGIVDVSVTAKYPAIAARIANTYVRAFVKEQVGADASTYKSVLRLVRKQLRSLSPKQRIGADGLSLQNREQALSILSELKQGRVQVAQEASVPSAPSSPKTSSNTTIGGVVGLFIGFALAFILESLDRRIRMPEDLENVYGLPLLGSVPRSKALRRKGTVLPPAEAEVFGLIRAHLRILNADRDLHAVAIVSAEAGDGKSTIARGLAEAAARSGSRALLMEMDLRRPTLARQLDIQSGPGAVEVLSGSMQMWQATRSIALEEPLPREGGTERTLDVLLAGAALPPNPGMLIEGQAMEAVLAYARSAYDLVVIDTPPLALAPDAFPLLTKVDGVIVVGRLAHSRRDAAERLRQILASSGVPLVGVIANGSKSGGPGLYHRDGKSSPAAVSSNSAASSEASLMPAGGEV